jgi:signal transduction histidine kinase
VLIALIAALLALAAVAVTALRERRRHAAQLRELAGERDRERERATRLAVAEERAKLAHELHELIAQRLDSIVLQSGIPLGDEDEPERARRRLNTIHRSAEEALGELQRAVELQGETQPGLARLPELVEQARAAGMPVTLHVEGEPRHIAPGIDLSAFRIVQEALANVHRHARGAPATVRVVWDRRELSLQVRDAGTRAAADGASLLSIRERVEMLGGELESGRLPSGGFEVRVVLPL